MTAIDRLRGSLSSVAIKTPVRVATTANIMLSGLQTIDGVSLAAGDRVLVKDQDDAVENGIYLANTSGWSRASDFNGARDAVKGTQVVVNEGTTQTDYRFKVTTDDPIVIGSDEIGWEQISDGPQGAAGTPGAAGTNGASFLSGAGAPSSGLGSNGDTYINTSNGDVYLKSAGSWSATGANLRGPQGAQGIQGPQGASGSGSGDMVAANNLSDLVNAGTARTNLGLGSLATKNTAGTSDVDNDAITYAKMQNVSATSRVLGRKSSGAGDAEELTLSEILDFIGSAAQGDILYRGSSTWARLAKGSAGQVLTMNAGATAPEWAAASGSSAFSAGHIFGLTLSNNGTDATNDIDIAAGSARDCTNGEDMTLASAITKRLDASWAVGSGNGGLDGGTKANGPTYHIHEIKRTDTGVVDALFSLTPDSRSVVTMTIATPCVVSWVRHGLVAGATVKFSTTGALPTGITAGALYYVISTGLGADSFRISATLGGSAINTSGSQSGVHTAQATPILPSNYNKFRRIGSIMTDGSGTIRPFIQDGDEFRLKTRITASLGDTSSRVSTTANVPTGLRLQALIEAKMTETAASLLTTPRYCVFTCPDENDVTPSTSPSLTGIPTPIDFNSQTNQYASYVIYAAGQFLVMTNTSGQIGYRLTGDGNPSIALATIGWRDTRGRHA